MASGPPPGYWRPFFFAAWRTSRPAFRRRSPHQRGSAAQAAAVSPQRGLSWSPRHRGMLSRATLLRAGGGCPPALSSQAPSEPCRCGSAALASTLLRTRAPSIRSHSTMEVKFCQVIKKRKGSGRSSLPWAPSQRASGAASKVGPRTALLARKARPMVWHL